MKPTLKVVIGIIQKENEVLIARKAEDRPQDDGIINKDGQKDFLLGLWHFPGGKVEESDIDLIKAIEREVEQETGLNIEVQELLGERIEEREKVVLYIHWYSCKYISGEAKPGDDIVEVMWIKKEEALKFCSTQVIEQWPREVLKFLHSK